MPHIISLLAHHCPAVAACLTNNATAIVLLSKGAFLGMAGFFVSALVATLAGRSDSNPPIALFVPLTMLLGICTDSWVFQELSSILQSDFLDPMVQTMGVLSGVEPE